MRFVWLWMLLCCSGLHGCATTDMAKRYGHQSPSEPFTEDYFNVDIPTHDGLKLRATVYQPKLAPGETAPVIIHTHGFGGFRANRPLSIYGQLILSGRAAMAAWHQGYWVISYDQRGFGHSDGEVHLMHPDYEVRDLSSVIDWVEKELPRVQSNSRQGLLIGTIGESYGGALQILGSMRDDRIDALVPITTWYDLSSTLAPNQQVKSAWGSTLLTFGTLTSGFDFGMGFEDDYMALFGGTLNERVAADFALRSPGTYCEQGQGIQADALFLQGFRDTLMPMKDGYRSWQCAQASGRDARLIAIQDGHILPWPMQRWSGLPMYNTQDDIVCGDKVFDAIGMILQWWDEKLRQRSGFEHAIPSLCVTFANEEGVELKALRTGGPGFAIRATRIKLAQSGLLEAVLAPVDVLLGWFRWDHAPLPAQEQDTTGGWLRPAFIPLTVIERDTDMIGFPLLDIELTTTNDERDGVVFAALGVRKPGSSYVDVLSEQFTPLSGDGRYSLEMPAVAHRLMPGDTVGLVAQGFTAQYFLNPRGWLTFGTLSGRVRLPLIGDQTQAPGDESDTVDSARIK